MAADDPPTESDPLVVATLRDNPEARCISALMRSSSGLMLLLTYDPTDGQFMVGHLLADGYVRDGALDFDVKQAVIKLLESEWFKDRQIEIGPNARAAASEHVNEALAGKGV